MLGRPGAAGGWLGNPSGVTLAITLLVVAGLAWHSCLSVSTDAPLGSAGRRRGWLLQILSSILDQNHRAPASLAGCWLGPPTTRQAWLGVCCPKPGAGPTTWSRGRESRRCSTPLTPVLSPSGGGHFPAEGRRELSGAAGPAARVSRAAPGATTSWLTGGREDGRCRGPWPVARPRRCRALPGRASPRTATGPSGDHAHRCLPLLGRSFIWPGNGQQRGSLAAWRCRRVLRERSARPGRW